MGFPVKATETSTLRIAKPRTSMPKPQNMPQQPSELAPAPVNGDSRTHQPIVEEIEEPASISHAPTKEEISEPAISALQDDTYQQAINANGIQTSEPATFAQSDDTDLQSDEPLLSDQDLNAIATADLWQGGVLSQRLPGYEERPAQVEMASLVSRAITEYVPAIVEASTGTGKSLAYLVPVVRSGQTAIISTANKALQEQLFYKDIPFVQKNVKSFEAALVKGVNNYVCLNRVESERIGIQFYVKNRDFTRLLNTLNNPPAGFNGDFETLGYQLATDIRSKVATDSDECAWTKCEYFGECYVRKMRARAERAKVIVVNHTLLLLDAVSGGHLLPDRDVIILDEAHHLEEEATRCFTTTVHPVQI